MRDKTIIWSEPQLKFKLGIQESIIDPKVGLLSYGPLDYNSKRRQFSEIKIAVVCKDISRVLNHLNKLNSYFPKQKVGDVEYKGFQSIYKLPIRITAQGDAVQITDKDISKTLNAPKEMIFEKIIELYEEKIQELHDKLRGKYDVMIIQIPRELNRYNNPKKSQNLRDSIKAISIRRNIVTQIITEKTLLSSYDCDNMWNLSLGIYVKASGVPWMLKDFTDTKSFIGISYGIKKLEKGQRVFSGIAEIFNEFGEHVSMVSITSEAFRKDFTLETDGSYHLSGDKISILIEKLMEEYKKNVGNFPDKVVLHKTTYFNSAEKEGIRNVLSGLDITYDLVNIIENPSLRLFTDGYAPPPRGTFKKVNLVTGLIYTTGYVEQYGTYPGIGIPKPLEFSINEGNGELEKIGKEILALTKMDWNTAHLMIRKPVTVKYASNIVNILKAGLQPDEVVKDIRYYM